MPLKAPDIGILSAAQHGGGLGAAPGGLGFGELGPDPGRVQAGGPVAGSPGQHGGLADYRVELGQRVRGAAGGGAAGARTRASLW